MNPDRAFIQGLSINISAGCSFWIFTSVGLHSEKVKNSLNLEIIRGKLIFAQTDTYETSYLDYSIHSFKDPGIFGALAPWEVCFWHQNYQKDFFCWC
eukprot:sb/3479021/